MVFQLFNPSENENIVKLQAASCLSVLKLCNLAAWIDLNKNYNHTIIVNVVKTLSFPLYSDNF